LLDAGIDGKFAMITSIEQLVELEDVLRRPKFSIGYRLSDERRSAILDLIEEVAVFAEPTAIPEGVVRDPKDTHIVGAAIAGSADFLISGDKDLLVLTGHPILGSVEIVTAAEFLTKLDRSPLRHAEADLAQNAVDQPAVADPRESEEKRFRHRHARIAQDHRGAGSAVLEHANVPDLKNRGVGAWVSGRLRRRVAVV